MIGRTAVVLAAALALLALAACGGPRPVVDGVELRPPKQDGQPYLLVVTLRNASGGQGQVTVSARITGANGQVAASEEQHTASLSPHEVERLTIDVQPAAPGPYTVEVKASYPP